MYVQITSTDFELQNPLRSFRQTMRFEDMVVLCSSDPVRMNFEHSWRDANQLLNSLGEQKNNTTVTFIHIIPSKGYSYLVTCHYMFKRRYSPM